MRFTKTSLKWNIKSPWFSREKFPRQQPRSPQGAGFGGESNYMSGKAGAGKPENPEKIKASAGKSLGLGLQIRQRRLELGLSQAQLGRVVGMKQNQVMDLEYGRYEASTRTIAKFLSALGGKLPPVVWEKNYQPVVPPAPKPRPRKKKTE